VAADHGEPVPSATQFAALCFLAGVQGYIGASGGDDALRITLHRTTTIEGELFLQQVAPYLGGNPLGAMGQGRIFAVTTGAMGEAYRTRKIVRTRHYDAESDLRRDILADMQDTNDARDPASVPLSYLAIPALAPDGKRVVAIVYADTMRFNFFADDDHVRSIREMFSAFCSLLDNLEQTPVQRIANFPDAVGKEVTSAPGVYRRVQETHERLEPIQFERVKALNYEIVV
jgi:hypothetical protein